MRTFLTITLTASLAACSGKAVGSYKVQAAGEAAAEPAVTDEADAHWALRDQESELKAALDAYEAVLAVDPTNRKALTLLVRGTYLWGDAFTDDKDAKIERWGKAIEWGSQCLALNPQMAEAIRNGTKEKDAVALATVEDSDCLYWTATALGKWGKAQSLSKTLAHLPTVKAYISRVEELTPTTWYYGPARYWGAYYSALPKAFGGDVEKSAAYLEQSIAGAPEYLGTYVIRAEYLATATDDVALFDKDLAYVLATDPGVEEIAPENALEKIKATKLIALRGELFTRKAIEAVDGTAQ